jgi:hypothetical protein
MQIHKNNFVFKVHLPKTGVSFCESRLLYVLAPDEERITRERLAAQGMVEADINAAITNIQGGSNETQNAIRALLNASRPPTSPVTSSSPEVTRTLEEQQREISRLAAELQRMTPSTTQNSTHQPNRTSQTGPGRLRRFFTGLGWTGGPEKKVDIAEGFGSFVKNSTVIGGTAGGLVASGAYAEQIATVSPFAGKIAAYGGQLAAPVISFGTKIGTMAGLSGGPATAAGFGALGALTAPIIYGLGLSRMHYLRELVAKDTTISDAERSQIAEYIRKREGNPFSVGVEGLKVIGGIVEKPYKAIWNVLGKTFAHVDIGTRKLFGKLGGIGGAVASTVKWPLKNKAGIAGAGAGGVLGWAAVPALASSVTLSPLLLGLGTAGAAYGGWKLGKKLAAKFSKSP